MSVRSIASSILFLPSSLCSCQRTSVMQSERVVESMSKTWTFFTAIVSPARGASQTSDSSSSARAHNHDDNNIHGTPAAQAAPRIWWRARINKTHLT